MSRRRDSVASVVPNDGISPACRKCKLRKRKCDRSRPACSNCVRTKSDCVYETPSSEIQQRITISRLKDQNQTLQDKLDALQRQLDVATTASTLNRSSTSPAGGPPQQPAASSVTHVAPANLPSFLTEHAPSALLQFPPSIAERIAIQLFNAEVDLGNLGHSLVASVAQQLGLPVKEILDQTNGPGLLHIPDDPTLASLPPKHLADVMVERYFDCVNCYQPLLDPDTVLEDFNALYPSHESPSILAHQPLKPDIRIFRMFMVLAIGCNLLPCAMTDGICDARQLKAWGTSQFLAGLRADKVTCLVSICLYCLFAMTDAALMDPYQSVRTAAKLAVELGFHQDDASLPMEEREMRKRVFWSIYGMDRSISFSLTRPFAISEHIIGTTLPTSVFRLPSSHTNYMPPIALFCQTIFLRRLQGLVLSDVYLSPPLGEEAEDASSRIRNEIDVWYEGLPRLTSPSLSLATARFGQPHPYLQVNYHLLLVRLYSPSPLMRGTPAASMIVLRESAFRLMEIYGAVDGEYRVQRNHITLAHIAFACVALVYTLIEAESTPANLKLVSWRRRALSQLESAERYLAGFCSQSIHAMSYTKAFAKLTGEVKNRLTLATSSPRQPVWTDGRCSASESSGTSSIMQPSRGKNGFLSTADQSLMGIQSQPHQQDRPGWIDAIESTVDTGNGPTTHPWSWDHWWTHVTGGPSVSSQAVNAIVTPDANSGIPTTDMDKFLAEFGLGAFAT